MRLIEVFRTATFRTAALAACAFGISTLLLFGLVYWQTALLETARIDQFLGHESVAIARETGDLAGRDLGTRYARDLHRQTFAALFTRDRRLIAGDMASYPAELAADGTPRTVTAIRNTSNGSVAESARAVARTLQDGRLLLVGRSMQQVTKLRNLVVRALELGLLPAMVSALCIGALASWRSLATLQQMNDTIARIMQGQLSERLTNRPGGDAFDRLARSVNQMLDEIERLMAEIQGVGDDIAHDLRTPLTRVRARLEGARTRGTSPGDLTAAIDRSIQDLDQCFTMITALLRIGQIEGSARRSGFGAISLGAIAREAVELYQPVAELREIALSLSVEPDLVIAGDRDLLFEVAANLLDNAVKFTPQGGRVTISIRQLEHGPVLAVRDTGPGIAPEEWTAVMKRFHRAAPDRNVPGHGLGLSLVAAILRLHRFHLHMVNADPGLLVEMRTWPGPE